ncbi:hypothetical protein D3C73_1301030 [compost metagenome]
MVPVKNHLAKADKELDHLSGIPPFISQGQMKRHFVMGQGDHWLHPVRYNFVDQVIIEFQTFFIRLLFVAVRKNSCPIDRGAKGF